MNNSSPRYIFFTNIPTPYRTAFYNSLSEYSDFDFAVFYMRDTEGDRSWSLDRTSLTHKYVIDNGYYRMFGRYHLHINPRMLLKLLRLKASCEIVIGGPWNDINVLILILLKRIGFFRPQIHFWSEANYLTLGASNDNILKKIMRKFVYNCTSGAQLSSGRMTDITLDRWGVRVNKLIPLPNTIDEAIFNVTDDVVESRSSNDPRVFLIPARIHEIVKGIKNFFEAIGADNVRRYRFIVAGDGPDRMDLQQYIIDNNYENNIDLIGHCEGNAVAELYRKANVFVLASFTDASPLTVVEALRMRMPLLISERCGNHFEAIESGVNGYLFNPYDHSSIKNSFELLIKRDAEWENMGRHSQLRYEKYFKKGDVIDRFVKEMNLFCNARVN